MNHYHIYEEIGRGKHSKVYKGRKKRTIEYYAIKSVDKSQKNKLQQEVKILHSLDHPNVLKFYSWHGTSAHLWLVLEYCVGGDLMSILKQDGRFPEESIHDLGRDLVKALQYLHSKGIIYCDLKPSNVLLDENGRMKLCDFGLARKLSDISESDMSSLPHAKRGTPCYMAPELFQDGGVHSYASDFWALGCVLYECYAGRPPFVGSEFTHLVNSILSDPIPSLPGNPSDLFVDLVNCLLVKDPAERVQWPELCEHGFWRTKLELLPLPPQPAFTNMLHLFTKPHLSERNDNKPVQHRTPPKSREKVSNKVHEQDENSVKGLNTPIKSASVARKAQTKVGSEVASGKQKLTANVTRGMNILRLSRIAKSNLQRENERENYRKMPSKNAENDTEVKIENTDMELDFSEHVDEDGQDEFDTSDSPAIAMSHLKFPDQVDENDKIECTETEANQMDINKAAIFDEAKTSECDSLLDNVDVPATPPIVSINRRTPRTNSGLEGEADAFNAASDPSQVMWHPSDLSVRPVMQSKKNDKVFEAGLVLPFDALGASDFVKLSPEQLESFVSRITNVLAGSSPVLEKQNTIKYLEFLSLNTEAANTVTNGPIMLVIVKMLRQAKTSPLRVQLASLVGLLIRHATFINTDLANSGIMGALTDGIRDKQEKVRRFSMAALGELLFYISTQDETHSREAGVLESPSKESRTASGWQIPNALIALVSSVLRKGEEDMTQLYALRTIENICSQGSDWAGRFTSQDVIGNLCYIYKAMGKSESARLTAGSCLVRLARFTPTCIQQIMEKLSFRDAAAVLVKGGPREQQISLNLLNMAMIGTHIITNMGRNIQLLFEEKNLVSTVVSLVEQGSEVLRGKALIFVSLVCRNLRKSLSYFFCNGKLLSGIDRLAKGKDDYVRKCLEVFVTVIGSTVPGLLEIISGDVQQMMGGKRHGQIAALSGRSNPRVNVHFCPVILHLLGSSSFKHQVVNGKVLNQLANLIKFLESPFQGRDDFQITLLRIIEAITEEPSVVLEDSQIFLRRILPSLAVLYKGNKDADARFLCTKLFFDLMEVFLNELSNAAEKNGEDDIKSLSDTYFLPLYPNFIEDEDPIPMYAQKLLVMLIESNFVKISDILHLKTVSQCFEFLLGDLSCAMVNNVKLCINLASAPEMEGKTLSQLRVVRKIGNLLEFVIKKEMDDFLEPTLCLCKAFLLRCTGSYSKEPALLGSSAFGTALLVDPHNCVKDIADFGCNTGAFLKMSGAKDAQVADVASECVVLLLKAAPREGTMGLLTNLHKLTCVLESWYHGLSRLQLLRLLHATGFACRQYLSQGMILSIASTEIAKLDSIVSDIRSSNMGGVSEVAMVVSAELQRLPRCI